MNIISIKNVALGIALSATMFSAKAQTAATEGSVTYDVTTMGNVAETIVLYKGDTSSVSFHGGPATVRVVSTLKDDYVSVLVDIPVAQKKLIAVATPGDIEEMADMLPSYTFTASTETKKIGAYNCTKYVAKDAKSGKNYDVWITKDITLAPNGLSKHFKTLPGTPVQFTNLQQKVEQLVTLKSVADTKVPAGSFSVPADATSISWTQLQAMMGGKR